MPRLEQHATILLKISPEPSATSRDIVAVAAPARTGALPPGTGGHTIDKIREGQIRIAVDGGTAPANCGVRGEHQTSTRNARTGALPPGTDFNYPLFMETLASHLTSTFNEMKYLDRGTSDPRPLAYTWVSRPMYPLDDSSARLAMRDFQECVHV
ncbi:MAG: hypothetical protein H0T72_15105 [Chloroflexia bacterium]|nr:hypothetical protein [Chloroflexia bacterium]